MPSLKKINAAAGTSFTRVKQLVAVLEEHRRTEAVHDRGYEYLKEARVPEGEEATCPTQNPNVHPDCCYPVEEAPVSEIPESQRRIKAQIDAEKAKMAEPVKVPVSVGATAEYHEDKFVLHFDDRGDHTRVLTMDGEMFKGDSYFAEQSPMTINYGWPDGYRPTHDPPFWQDNGPVLSWKLYYMEDPKGHFRHGIAQWYPKDAVKVYEGEKLT